VPRKRASHAVAADLASLWFDAAAVITVRSSLLALHAAPAGEAARMVSEKPQALLTAALAGSVAAGRAMAARPFDPLGATLDAAAAWTRVLAPKVRRNRRRLLG
jgi:hypothetical protein